MNDQSAQLPNKCVSCLVTLVAVYLATVSMAHAQELAPVFRTSMPISVPAGSQAQEPSIAVHGGALVMSWLDVARATTKVRVARRTDDVWSQPVTVASGEDLFVNWADFPGIAPFGNDGLTVHWLRKSGRSSFDYNVEIAISNDNGITWAEPVIPHSDRSQVQHGFVSMSAAPDGLMDAIWLDGRAYGRVGLSDAPDAMQLRATRLGLDGRLEDDVAIDVQTCSCCQTSAARLGDGALVVAYRDRTDSEVRDISVVRYANGAWAYPVTVHPDGWEISGCPVNGPAIAAEGQRVSVVWFTGADDVAAVKLAFSTDGGASFGPPQRIDTGEPLGRVDAAMLADGSALVTWLEWDGDDEVLQICRAVPEQGCVARQALVRNAEAGSMNFPRMAVYDTEVFIAWTQSTQEGDSTIALLRGTLLEPASR